MTGWTALPWKENDMALFDRLLRRTAGSQEPAEDLAGPSNDAEATGSYFDGKFLAADDLRGEQRSAAAGGWPAKWELSGLDDSSGSRSSVMADLTPGESLNPDAAIAAAGGDDAGIGDIEALLDI